MLPHEFSVPDTWGTRYSAEAGRIQACTNYGAIDEARTLMAAFIDPVLAIEQLGNAASDCETLHCIQVK